MEAFAVSDCVAEPLEFLLGVVTMIGEIDPELHHGCVGSLSAPSLAWLPRARLALRPSTRRFLVASWLLGSAKFACVQRQKPAMFAQMPLSVYRHFTGAVCTTSSDGRFMGMIAFTEFPTIAARHRTSSSPYNADWPPWHGHKDRTAAAPESPAECARARTRRSKIADPMA